MKKLIFGIFVAFLITHCSSDKNEYLVKIYDAEYDEIGVPSCYVNSKGDTVVPTGKYYYCYTDTIRNLGIVMENKNGRIIGIDKNAKELFEVFKYDNGPDYIQDGLFRIIKNGKIGYANENGEIVIEPKFDCAFPFENGTAKVSYNCYTKNDGEHSIWKSDDWFYINKKGEQVEKQ